MLYKSLALVLGALVRGGADMKKVQFFILVEVVLLTLALIEILHQDFSRFMIILTILLLAIRYGLGKQTNNFFLTAASAIFFLILMVNPYVILGLLFAVIYMLINYFAQIKTEGYYQRIRLNHQSLSPVRERMKWWGSRQHGGAGTHDVFDDINLTRLFGNDIVDLDESVFAGRDNVIMIRKTIGHTKIILPVDAEVDLLATTLYGQVKLLDHPPLKLHNEMIKLRTPEFMYARKRVKVVVNVLLGDVEVIRL